MFRSRRILSGILHFSGASHVHTPVTTLIGVIFAAARATDGAALRGLE
jgi:hypothetical protein